MNINRFTLPNGLRVVHQHDTSTAMVAVDTLYNVGARDEVNRTRGLAHLFEHVMFTGSPNVPDFEAELQGVGAINNAWTSNDFTNFYEYGPAMGLEAMLKVESDRMRALNFDVKSVENQRSVVTEEFKQTCLNRPYGDLQHYLSRLVYGVNHQYSVPVIGSTIDVLEQIKIDDMRHWHDTYFVPANAVLAICGNVDFVTVSNLVERYFGSIPGGKPNNRSMGGALPGVSSTEVTTVRGAVPQPLIVMSWLMDRYGTKEYYAADCLSDVLSEGRSSRFYRDIMRHNDFIADADASISGSEGQGMFMVTSRVDEVSDDVIEKTIALLLESVRALGDGAPVIEKELQRAKNKYRSRFLFSNLDCASRATTLAMSEMHGEEYETQLHNYESLTVEMLTNSARKLFAPPPAIVIYRP